LETINTNKTAQALISTRYVFDEFEIDPGNRTCARDGKILPISGKAFDVLMAFIENPGRLLSKDELLEKVWTDEFVEEGNLARNVFIIRKALGDTDKDHRYIVTVSGHGYRFNANLIRTGWEVSKDIAISTQDFESAKSEDARPTVAKEPEYARSRSNLFLFGGGLLLLALLSGFFIFPSWRSVFSTQSSTVDSIAVLPFENSTGDADLDYLSDGITENVINALSPLPNLRVLPRSMVFAYKGNVQDPYSVGTTLGVHTVLTGILVERNGALTIQTELIDIQRKSEVWGQQYVYSPSDVSKIQSNIAEQVVRNMRLQPPTTLQDELSRRSTTNPEAQKAYMWGLYYFNQALNDPTQKSYDLRVESIKKLQEATSIDPNFAQAFAVLARSYQSLSGFGENRQKAKDAARNALDLDETNPTAHSIMGMILWQNDWDWVGAEREFKRAIEISPNEAHKDYADLLSAECRHDEAIREIKIAEELDPLNQQIKADLGLIYKDARQYDLAIDQLNSVLQMNPDLISSRFALIEAYVLKGRSEEAESESENLLKLSDQGDTRLFVGSMYAYMGRRDEATQIYDEYNAKAHPTSILMASIASSLGDSDAAFSWLEKAFSSHSWFLLGVKSSPIFDRLHEDPRFADLLKRMGFPP